MLSFDKYIGLEYENLGRGPKYDCFGLVWIIFKNERGIVLPDFTELKYSEKWYKKENHILNSIWDAWKEVEYPYTIFDIPIFYLNSIVANHIGCIISDGKFIHICENQTSMVSRLDNFWKNKLYKVIRYIG